MKLMTTYNRGPDDKMSARIDFIWQPLYIKYLSGMALGRGYAYFPTAFIFVYAVTLALSYAASRNSKINLLLFGDKGRIVNT